MISLAGTSLARIYCASFGGANLIGADFTGAVVAGASFSNTNLTAQQLYSTSSYQTKTLSDFGFNLSGDNLSAWNFNEQNLNFANFINANLSNTSFVNADLRQAQFSFSPSTPIFAGTNLSDADLRGTAIINFSGAITHNTIMGGGGAGVPDGTIAPLSLASGEKLIIRDGGTIFVDQGFSLQATSVLHLAIDGTVWGSTLYIDSGVSPQLAGILDLEFAAGTSATLLVGASFRLFNWNGQLAPGQHFDQIISQPGYVWDTSKLYTTGLVTLTAVPEPATILLALCALCSAACVRATRSPAHRDYRKQTLLKGKLSYQRTTRDNMAIVLFPGREWFPTIDRMCGSL